MSALGRQWIERVRPAGGRGPRPCRTSTPRSILATVPTVSFLFVDQVGSTEQLRNLGDRVAAPVRRSVHDVLTKSVAGHGGRVVDNTGDGVMAVFEGAVDAVTAGTAMMQAATRLSAQGTPGREVILRVGVHTGDPVVDDDGRFLGMSVVVAARLCAVAQPGQLLVSDLVRALVSPRGAFEFEPAGDLTLKGVGEPVTSFAVSWAPLRGEAITGVPLPARLAVEPTLGMFGRSAERATLEAAWQRARSGTTQTLLLSGEAGVGKTRLSTELAAAAHDEGGIVLYGCPDEDLGVAYQPWVEALSHLVEHAPDELLAAHVDRKGTQVARLVPDLQRRMGERAEPDSDRDPESERFLLFAAVVDLLGATANDAAPLLVVLDDLHWVDRSSLFLLKHLVTTGDNRRLLVLASYRDTDLSAEHPLTAVLADLHRVPGVERLALAGLSDRDLIEMMESVAGQEIDENGVSLAQLVRRETDGNPFFVIELLRYLAESDAISEGDDGPWALRGDLADLGLPQSVRDVIGRRVARLGADATRVLALAAVIGREFDVDLLATVADVDEDGLVDLLEAGAASNVVTEITGGRYMFNHALIEHTLYQDLSATRRQRAHHRIGEALEVLNGDQPGDRIGELAYHWCKATRRADVTKALFYARAAGDRALDQLAPADAIRWYARALEFFDEAGGRLDAPERCELVLRLGDAQRQAGDPAHRQTLLDAAHLADRLGDTDKLVRAALANFRGTTTTIGELDVERVAVIEGALGALSPQDSRERALLLVTLAGQFETTPRSGEAPTLAAEAMDMARRLDEPATLLRVANGASYALRRPDTLEQARALSEESLRLAARVGDPVLECFAHYMRANSAMRGCDLEAADESLTRFHAVAQELAQPFLGWQDASQFSWRTLLAGHVTQAERLAEEALELGTRAGQPDALLAYGGQLFDIRYHQGRLAEVEDLYAAAAVDYDELPIFRSNLAHLYCELGKDDDARRTAARDVSTRFAEVPRDFLWITTVVQCADVAAYLRDEVTAEWLYNLLTPYTDQAAFADVATRGVVVHRMALLAALLGRSEAERHFADTLAIYEQWKAPFWIARTKLEWGGMLSERGSAGDCDQAIAFWRDALAISQERGYARLERDAGALLA